MVPDPAPRVPDPDPASTIRFRHSSWQPTRERVRRAMVEAYSSDLAICQFDNCGCDAYLAISDDDPPRYGVKCFKCHNRFCKPCARERAGIVSRNLLEQVKDKELRFITLTLKTQSDDLSAELDRLYESFRKLQRKVFWRRHVWGGAALLEVKYNPGSDRWHPHLHIIAEGRYIAQQRLRSAWYEVTGDSFIVDVRAIKNNARVTQYVTKYATDPLHSSVLKSEFLIAEAIRAFKRRRTCLTFGTWRGFKLTGQDSDVGWTILGKLEHYLWQIEWGAQHEEEIARSIVLKLWRYEPRDEKGFEPHGPPDPGLFDTPF